MVSAPPRPRRKPVLLLLPALLAGCAAMHPPEPGSSREALLARWGAPTARHALPDGAQRLEYASGPFGKTTWMVDIGPDGRVRQARQVLTEGELMATMAVPDLRVDELLRRIGSPGEKHGGGRAGGQVWSWRYDTNDCLRFQVSIADDGRVGGSGFFIDPTCDGPPDRPGR